MRTLRADKMFASLHIFGVICDIEQSVVRFGFSETTQKVETFRSHAFHKIKPLRVVI